MEWNIFYNAYSKASIEKKHLIDCGVIGDCVEQICTDNTLLSSIQAHIVIVISHLILGTISLEQAEIELKKKNVPEALTLIQQLTTCITSAGSNTHIELKEEEDDDSLASEIAEAEAAIQTMQPIRTMSHDMETMRSALGDEPVHTAASQADLLDRTATPKADAPDDRWNTAQT